MGPFYRMNRFIVQTNAVDEEMGKRKSTYKVTHILVNGRVLHIISLSHANLADYVIFELHVSSRGSLTGIYSSLLGTYERKPVEFTLAETSLAQKCLDFDNQCL